MKKSFFFVLFQTMTNFTLNHTLNPPNKIQIKQLQKSNEYFMQKFCLMREMLRIKSVKRLLFGVNNIELDLLFCARAQVNEQKWNKKMAIAI